MHKEVTAMLERSPRPLPWTLTFLLALFGAIVFQSLILAVIAGLIIGFYEGNFCGRLRVLAAWKRDIQLDREAIEQRLCE